MPPKRFRQGVFRSYVQKAGERVPLIAGVCFRKRAAIKAGRERRTAAEIIDDFNAVGR